MTSSSRPAAATGSEFALLIGPAAPNLAIVPASVVAAGYTMAQAFELSPSEGIDLPGIITLVPVYPFAPAPSSSLPTDPEPSAMSARK